MDFYKRLIIKILDRSLVGSDDEVLKKLKQGRDLNQQEMRYLEELLENII